MISSGMRVLFGKVADKFGGAILTHITGIAMTILFAVLILGGYLTPTSADQFPMFLAIMLTIFFFTGVGNAATFKQYPTIFAASPRKSAGVIGWTAAVAAFGPFIFSVLISQSNQLTGNSKAFFWSVFALCIVATWINWYFYTRKGCERPS